MSKAAKSPGRHDAYASLLKRCASMRPAVTAVAYPCERTALVGAVEAAEQGLIDPILVGPQDEIRKIARDASVKIDSYRLEDVKEAPAAAARAVEIVRQAEAQVLMKG